jgi:hypothetical protein
MPCQTLEKQIIDDNHLLIGPVSISKYLCCRHKDGQLHCFQMDFEFSTKKRRHRGSLLEMLIPKEFVRGPNGVEPCTREQRVEIAN